MTIDPQARYLSSHEWARPEGELYVCGISDHAQDALGDVVYVDLPPVGSVFAREAVFGVVESVKAANDLYAPLSGEVVEVNEAVNQHPEQVNKDPYGAGWMVKIRASAPGEWDSLLDAKAYGELS